MKEFDVSLNVVTDSQSLSELSGVLQHPPDSGSHSRGDRRIARSGVFSETVWSLRSEAPPTVPIEEHLRSMKSLFSPDRLSALPEEKKAVIKEVFIDIGVFFEVSTFPQILLTREDLQLVQAYGASLRIVCYPVEQDSAES